jgi:hypothetical protein
VFDPLAVILILAGQQSIRWAKEEKLKENQIIKSIDNLYKKIITYKKNLICFQVFNAL